MPRVKSVKSLTEICVDKILESRNIFCEKFPLGEIEDCVDALDSDKPAVNPFDDLPSELMEELIRVLREKESSELYPNIYKIAPLLKLLMTPRLRTLDLTKIDKRSDDISDVIHLATIRSPNLETLRIDSSPCKYIKDFNFIPKFVKLRILEISFPEADDDCFCLIGRHCPALRELHCNGCQATDDGILKLCVVGNCKLIRKLNLESCSKITTKGIQMALDNLPQLRILCHESLLECLAGIAQIAIDQKISLPKYSLSALYILQQTVYKTGSLRQSVLICPNVTEVYLTIRTKGFYNTDISSLLSLEKLNTFEITYIVIFEQIPGGRVRTDRHMTFDGIIPLLKKFGICLKKLMIGYFLAVDIPIIIEFCPNLESLTLDCCKTTQSPETKVKRLRLQKLKKFTLSFSIITSENLFKLLSSPSLSYICLSMSYCNALTDNVLQRAAKIHSFRNLERLHLYHCNLVTKNGIDIFLQESNPLREIMLCLFNLRSGITKEDIIDWNNSPIWIQKNWQFNFILTCSYKNIYLGGHIWEGPEGEGIID